MSSYRTQLAVFLALLAIAPAVAEEGRQAERDALLEEYGAIVRQLEKDEMPYQISNPQRPRPDVLTAILPEARALLAESPNDFDALLMTARLERQAIRPEQLAVPPDMTGVHQLLDRALSLAPESAEAHYWKGRLHGEQVIAPERWDEDRQLVFAAQDLFAAIDHTSLAVDLAPDELRYREALALLLIENGENDRALETLRPVTGMEHPVFALLSDFASFPLPPEAERATTSPELLIFESKRWTIDRYEELRLSAYVLAGTADGVERYYAGLWPGFKLHHVRTSEEGAVRDVAFRQWVAREDDGWRIARHAGEIPEVGSMIQRGITIDVDEMHGLPSEMLSVFVPDHMLSDQGQVFTRILLTNHRLDVDENWKDIVSEDWVPETTSSDPDP